MDIAAELESGRSRRTRPDRIAFTEDRLAKLPLAVKSVYYRYDTAEPGLCARIARTTKAYAFYRWHNGEPGRLTIAKVGAITLREARAIAARHRGDLARGIDIFVAARLAKHAPKAVKLIDAYERLVARPDLRDKTRRDYASLWTRVPKRLQERKLAEVTGAEVVKLHGEVGASHPRTANKLVALLSVLFTRNGRRGDNPATEVDRFREAPRQRVLTIEELRRLRSTLDAEPEPWRSFFMLAMLTGARRGALARMQWGDLDLQASIWRIPAVWSKNRRVLAVALPQEAVAILSERSETRGAAPWVFPANTKAGHMTEPMKAWRRVAKRACIEGAVIHDLRRTIGTAVAADGGGAAVISAVLGHMSMQSAKSYLHLSAEMARGAVERAAARTRGAGDAAQN